MTKAVRSRPMLGGLLLVIALLAAAGVFVVLVRRGLRARRDLMTPRYQIAQTWPCPACAEPILVEANVCKHCGARMEDYDAEPAPAVIETPSSRLWRRHWWKALIVVLVLVALWARGTFDHLLLNVGLNAKECGRNGFGAVLCGKELDEYRARLQVVEHAAQQSVEAEEEARRAAAAEARRLEAELAP